MMMVLLAVLVPENPLMQVMNVMVPKVLTGVRNGTVNLGASLRDRATLPSQLRGLGPSGGYPSRRGSTPSPARPPHAPRDGAVRRARPGPRLARPGRLRRPAGFASARPRRTSCVAGAGFAGHRAPHCAAHCCPHPCGQHRLRLRQRAAHVCLRLRPLRPPLTRHGGSPPPGSPASIPPVALTADSAVPIARGGLGSHTRRI